MIKFFLKIFFAIVIAIGAVLYHNTESGRNLEKKVGKELSFETMKERGRNLYKDLMKFIFIKGLPDKESGNASKAKKDETIDKSPENIPTPKAENISESERRKLEEIIESGG